MFLMNFFRKNSVCLLIALAWNVGVFASSAASADNPYAPIVARNMFALSPLVSSAASTPPAPLPTITPNGIMSLFGSEQALFKVIDNQPGQPATETSYILGEGQGEGDIKVVRIDGKNAIVTFNNHGTIQELPLVSATASSGYPTASGNAGQTKFFNHGSLRRNRFASRAAQESGNQIPGESGNAIDSSGLGSGYAGGAYKNDPSGQEVMVPNFSLPNTSEGDNASAQSPAVSNDVGYGNNNVAGQGTDNSAAEELADEQMVAFARQHMD
jgi:hypothetical protein